MEPEDQSTFEYYVGGSLPLGSPTYVMRQADSDLFEALSKGRFCYVLNSRQMGKSSLRVQTAKRLKEAGIACASVDLSTIGSQELSQDQWYAGVVRVLARSLGPFLGFDLRNWWMERSLLSPPHKFSEFVEMILSVDHRRYVVFIDEIDSILSAPGGGDDFFAVIRSFYNARAENPIYNRVTFALLGVADPSDLIQDKFKTPYNIGRPIGLRGFTIDNVQPLLPGLAADPITASHLMREILNWTSGQPFLTQKLCKLVSDANGSPEKEACAAWVSDVVNRKIITDWEVQDDPEHLKTIRNRILESKTGRTARLLGLYTEILEHGSVEATDSPEHIELRLSGLVIEDNGRLLVHNKIYKAIFDIRWVGYILKSLRPYSEGLEAWLASGKKDSSRLLRGIALEEAEKWASSRSVSDSDYQYLAASQKLAAQDIEKNLQAEQQANRILTDAKTEADAKIRRARRSLFMAFVISGVLAAAAALAVEYARSKTQREQALLSEKQQVAEKLQKSVDDNRLTLERLTNSTRVLNEKVQVEQKQLEQTQRALIAAQQRTHEAEVSAGRAQQEAEERTKEAQASYLEVERQKKIAETRLRQLNVQQNKLQSAPDSH